MTLLAEYARIHETSTDVVWSDIDLTCVRTWSDIGYAEGLVGILRNVAASGVKSLLLTSVCSELHLEHDLSEYFVF